MEYKSILCEDPLQKSWHLTNQQPTTFVTRQLFNNTSLLVSKYHKQNPCVIKIFFLDKNGQEETSSQMGLESG